MNIWPDTVREETFSHGFSFGQIENLVSRKRGFWEALPKLSPIAFWETETYSFGKTYRSWLRWPWFVPLPMSGDHGVALQRKFSGRESNSGSRTYLTWSSWRAQSNVTTGLEVIQIPHPWITYRRSKSLKQRKEAEGTLVFIPHTIQGTNRAEFYFDDYFNSLESLPDQFKPISLCIQMHDVRKDLHLELEKYGYPIFTAGNSSSPYFVDRFYDLILRFRFCTSNVAGSQTFYCEEAGVPYFLFGLESQEQDQGGPARSAYSHNDPDLAQKVKQLFSYSNLGQSAEKDRFVSEALGLSINPETSGKNLRRTLVWDLFTLIPLLTLLVFQNAFTSLVHLYRSAKVQPNSGKNK